MWDVKTDAQFISYCDISTYVYCMYMYTVEAAYNDTFGTDKNCRYIQCVVMTDENWTTKDR